MFLTDTRGRLYHATKDYQAKFLLHNFFELDDILYTSQLPVHLKQITFKEGKKLFKEVVLSKLEYIVIGQRAAVDDILNWCFEYILKCVNLYQINEANLPTNNFLIAGVSGSGKSHIIAAICHACNLGYLRIDAPNTMPDVWRGKTISDVFKGFYASTRYIFNVIHIDEFDKILDVEADYSNAQLNIYLDLLDGKFEMVQGNTFKFPKSTTLTINDAISYSGIILSGSFSNIKSMNNNLQSQDSDKRHFLYKDLPRPTLKSQLLKTGMTPDLIYRINSFTALSEYKPDDIKLYLQIEKGKYESLYSITYNDLTDADYRSIISQCDNLKDLRGIANIARTYFNQMLEDGRYSEPFLISQSTQSIVESNGEFNDVK